MPEIITDCDSQVARLKPQWLFPTRLPLLPVVFNQCHKKPKYFRIYLLELGTLSADHEGNHCDETGTLEKCFGKKI